MVNPVDDDDRQMVQAGLEELGSAQEHFQQFGFEQPKIRRVMKGVPRGEVVERYNPNWTWYSGWSWERIPSAELPRNTPGPAPRSGIGTARDT